MAFEIGLLIFPDMTQLDMTGPLEVFAHLPGASIHLIWKSREPVKVSGGMKIVPTTTLQDCPSLDLICIPGGAGVNPLINDLDVLEFITRQAAQARYVTSVCTGALVLGAAGLLRGKRATTHWMSHHMLEAFGAVPVAERVVRDGNLITGGGITAGIDFALTVAADIAGEDVAKAIQLEMEYNPQPPFDAGSPERAGRAIVDEARAKAAPRQHVREAAIRTAVARLAL